MSAAWWVAGIIFSACALAFLTFAFAEGMLRKRDRDMIAMRDWQEKMNAMRRMADQEGDA